MPTLTREQINAARVKADLIREQTGIDGPVAHEDSPGDTLEAWGWSTPRRAMWLERFGPTLGVWGPGGRVYVTERGLQFCRYTIFESGAILNEKWVVRAALTAQIKNHLLRRARMANYRF